MINNISPEYRGLMAGASSTATSSAGSGLITTGSASNSLATGFDVVGTAYCAKAAGIDSFGIVPLHLCKRRKPVMFANCVKMLLVGGESLVSKAFCFLGYNETLDFFLY